MPLKPLSRFIITAVRTYLMRQTLLASPLGVHNRPLRVGVADGNAIKIRKSNEIMCRRRYSIYTYFDTLARQSNTSTV